MKKAQNDSFKISRLINKHEPEIDRFDQYLKKVGKEGIDRNVYFTIDYCRGGVVQEVERLIEVIEDNISTYVNLSITLGFTGYAISAAGFLFVYFTRYRLNSRVFVRNFTPLCVVYHKPRLVHATTKKLGFANPPPVGFAKNDVILINRLDTLFNDVFQSLITHFLDVGVVIEPHLIASYNTNGDAAFTFPKGAQ
ncbi:hypothetical protein AAF463_25190 (plasmid) [Pantoea sp. BJ2]|uniref:Uncharacterized protein n=1 Tax=Pantoea sp. BJ2 TaxID=3141322 RepID=A0AAU7U4I8_9GAMM